MTTCKCGHEKCEERSAEYFALVEPLKPDFFSATANAVCRQIENDGTRCSEPTTFAMWDKKKEILVFFCLNCGIEFIEDIIMKKAMKNLITQVETQIKTSHLPPQTENVKGH